MASESIRRLSFATEGATPNPSPIEDEVTALFELLRAPVLRYLLSFRLPVANAEEIVQEVFLALFRQLRKGKPRENLQGWIFKVAHNAASDLRRICRTRQQTLGRRHELSLLAWQRQQRLMSVVRALPERDQYCLSLRAEGLRYREIAEVLDISLGSVAASLEKSLSRLTRAERT